MLFRTCLNKLTIFTGMGITLALTNCSLITVPIETAGSIVTTTVKTTGSVIEAPFRGRSRDRKPDDDDHAASQARPESSNSNSQPASGDQ